ncbi:MAG: hypothetical protein KKD44_17915, partial [Proteobacteria bacterium]|nr:hypothetical protein [Pseudomonadota bacterium]
HDHFFIPGRPFLDELVIRFDDDPQAQMVYLEHQDVDILPLFIDPEGIDRLKKNESLIVTPQGYEAMGAINWLAFNFLRKPFDDKRVRKAIAYAIDPAFFNKFMNRGSSVRATGPISPFSVFYEPDVRMYDLDLKKAGDLLDQAGLTVKTNGIRFSVTLDYIPIIPSQQHDMAFYMKRQLSKIGIDVRVRISKDFKEWADHISTWDFDMTMDVVYNWGDPIIGVHRTYLSNNIRKGVLWSNTQNYRNDKVDAILGRAAMEMDLPLRKKLYSEFQRMVTEDLPVVWLNVMSYQTVYNKNLGNPPISIWGIHSPFDELYWKKAPVKTYVSIEPLGTEETDLEQVGHKAINLLKQKRLLDACEILEDQTNSYLDLEHSGLHVIGFTTNGSVFLDNSGQMKPGMDISGLRDLMGHSIVEQLVRSRDGQGDNPIRIDGVWPNPVTHHVGTMNVWCGKLTEDDCICVLRWE